MKSPFSPPAPTLALIGAPTDVGAGARGASMGPEALRVAGLQSALESHGLRVLDRGNLMGPANPWQPPLEGYRHLPEVVTWNQLVFDAVRAELRAGHLPLLLGGDHCLGLGSIAAVARHCFDTASSCASCGSTHMRISTPAHSPPAATCMACRWRACSAWGRNH